MKTTKILGLALLCMGLFFASPVLAYTRNPSGNVTDASFTLTITPGDWSSSGGYTSNELYVSDGITDYRISRTGPGDIEHCVDVPPWTCTHVLTNSIVPDNTQIKKVYTIGQGDHTTGSLVVLEGDGSSVLFTIGQPALLDRIQGIITTMFDGFWSQLTGSAVYIMLGMLLVSVIFWGFRKIYRTFYQ